MAYTNTWTTAAPLDTQAANQGAVDFRATKLDVMQRIASFGAGLLAARPTPEATSASADWTGVMYWATDTKQTFRWNGSSWDDISIDLPLTQTQKIFIVGGGTTLPDTTLETIYTGTVLANSLGTSGGIEGYFGLGATISAGQTLNVFVKFGSTSINILGALSNLSQSFSVSFSLINVNTGTQLLNYFAANNGNTLNSIFGDNVLSIDTTVDQTLSIMAQKSLLSDDVTFLNGYAKVI